ncbi:MAG: hypothetical protein BVN35_13540 [Proteobacteria bacterium ST_bin11]|jgi:hypothetical protein|nr:MAG: hypothetical protein BVN35_13540 [Proteobacteria bacterium ST_bin11]
MLSIKSKEISLAVCLCTLSVLLTPVPTQADTVMLLAAAETGSVAARQAADQKAALAKKAAEREAKKAAEAQMPAEAVVPAEDKAPAEVPKGK